MRLFYICIMETLKRNPKLDNIGMTASLLCAIHCAVVPIIITSLPFLGLSFLSNPLIEWGMIILAIVLGFYAIGISYLNKHHKLLPVILLLLGFIIIITGHLFTTGWHQAIVVPTGGLFIATSHIYNIKFNGQCHSAHKSFLLD